MINKILNYLIKIFFIQIYIFCKYQKNLLGKYDFNFQNILFIDNEYLKKIFLSDKFLTKKYLDEKSFTYHSFDWLNTAKNLGGVENVARSKKHIFNWYNKKYNKRSFVWNSSFISKRFINLIYNYDFYAISAANLDKILLDKIILEHFLIINLEINQKKVTELKIEEYKSLLLGFLIYNKNADKILKILLELLIIQIDKNGFHKSYNPMQQAEFLNNLHEIKK